MPIHCPYCNNKFQTRKLRAGRRTPQCPRCGERFVIWLEAFKLEDYKSAVETLQQNINAGADPVPASVKASAAAAPADSDSDLEVAVQAPAARATVAPAPAVETNGSRTAETAPPPPSQASEIEQTTDFESARGVLTADLSGRPDKKKEEEVDLSLNGFSLDIAESPEAPESIATSEPAAVEGVPASLGGYKILKELGRGGMGSVYLANQVALDRRVAVKTIRTELADDPIFLSRFTREAYAAAQLVHHNVVQVYDLGEDRGTHFFSMEFVEGLPLDKLISRGKALDSHDAVGYILQAARGLQFAHDHGMVHRDIKPANLLLNSHGVVKVADLGLVKTAGSEADDAAQVANPAIKSALDTKATAAGSTMGTPAFMAPEQAGDAAGVDHRADIYSLGCTLYSLVTGRLPFEGKTAIEVITKHKTEPLARPERIKAGVPSDVGDVVDLMTAKRPDDRPHDMGQVVNRLEELLHGGGRSPVERFGAAMEQAYHAFQAPTLAVWRPRILIAAVGIIALVAIGLLFQGRFGMAIAAVATGFASAVAYTIVQGVVDRTVVFNKLRQLAYSASWIDYLKVLFALAAAVAAIALTGLWLQAALVVAVGVGFAVAFQQGLDAQVKIARTPAIRQAESALRQARIAGLDETEVRRIAAEAGGKDWEELFELLFGYEAKREQRILLEQTAGRGLRRHAAWRDSLVDYVDSRAEAIRDAKQRRELQRVEAARLKAQGVDPQEAAARAANEASKIADHGATLRVSAREYFHASPERRIALRKMVAESLNHNRPQKPTFAKRLARAPLMLVGGGARFVAGTALLLLGLWWAQQNGVFEAAQEAAITSEGQLAPAGEAMAELTAMERLVLTDNRNPLSAAPPALARYCNGFHLAAGGLLLMASVLLRGWVGTPLAWMAGAAALVGPILLADQLEGLLPYVPPLTTAELVSFAGATLLLAAAWWFSD